MDQGLVEYDACRYRFRDRYDTFLGERYVACGLYGCRHLCGTGLLCRNGGRAIVIDVDGCHCSVLNLPRYGLAVSGIGWEQRHPERLLSALRNGYLSFGDRHILDLRNLFRCINYIDETLDYERIVFPVSFRTCRYVSAADLDCRLACDVYPVLFDRCDFKGIGKPWVKGPFDVPVRHRLTVDIDRSRKHFACGRTVHID